MTLLVPWLVLPLVLTFLSLGTGLLVERASATSLPSPLVPATGLAAIVVVSSLTVSVPATARLTTPLVAALAIAGFVVSGLRRPDWWAYAAAVATFLCYGAPVLASGQATFTGYVKLDDTATFLALTDRALEHGRSLGGLESSSYEAALSVNLAHGYPLGSLLPLGIGHELVRGDIAWLYQPWLAFCAAVLALCLYSVATPLIASRPWRAVAACVAAQPALLYGFASWGGVKELAAAAALGTAAALTTTLWAPDGLRAFVPFAVASAAVLDTLSVGGFVWLLPLFVPLLPLLRRTVAIVAVGLLAAVVLALPALASAGQFLRGSNRDVFSNDLELGNLLRPLRPLQIVGVWPTGDFRLDPDATVLTALLVALGVAACALGVVLAVKERAHPLLLALASALSGAVAFEALGGPWFAAKALAIGSPFVLLTAVCGCAGLASNRLGLPHRASRGTVAVGIAAGTALVVGVGWSNVLAYHDVDLAPRSQLAELARIGDELAGRGPALMTEYQPYGVRHFLRRLDAEGASELRRREIRLRSGRLAGKAEYVDLDQIELPDLLVYRTLVLRRSPTESRPPAPYELVWHGRWYDVWERPARALVAAHLPLGDPLQPGSRPECRTVRELEAQGSLVAPPRARNLVWALESASLPYGWSPYKGGGVVPGKTGVLTLPIDLPRGGAYRLWVGGSVRGTLRAFVDGKRVGSVSSQLQNAGQWLELGSRTLRAGGHRVTLDVSLAKREPGTGGGGFPLGPLLLEPGAHDDALVSASRAQDLCGRDLDWVEALGR